MSERPFRLRLEEKEDVARPAPGYGFGKRLKTAFASALVTSLFWAVFLLMYWPRGEKAEFTPTETQPAQVRNQPLSPPQPGQRPTFDAQTVYVPPRGGLKLPVQGVTPDQLADTYDQTRSNGTRGHDAIDIMAPLGTAVFAAAEGTLVKLFLSKDGGNTVYVRSPDSKAIYYYAHLDSYAAGLVEGMSVTQGQVLGFVGSTGDADPAAPHLHFAIMALAPGEDWWKGRPVNPYPFLGGR
ncbi:M23 family metallopeptidase [Novosphingobium sp.]|uniref:M23 family metallopeptidase n=1 Tax=Novosphingobium sp. TaxID=1874826 RepID=UPI003BA92549